MDVMQYSSNNMKAVDLLNEIIAESGCSANLKSTSSPYDSTSALSSLNGIIGEMECAVSHEKTSSEILGKSGGRLSVRRGASREIADTVTGTLKRPEDENSPDNNMGPTRRPREGSRLRREASQDLVSTITGDLKRPEDEPRDHRGSHLRREASSDLSSTVTGDLKRPSCSGISEGKNEELSNDRESMTALAHSTRQYANDAVTVNCLDLRVGKILSVSKHQSADKLYCESIDVGEEEPRNIASGLVPFYSLDEMQDRMVIVVCNLKPRKLCGFPSNGMVLCATSEANDDGNRKVELLCPPAGASPGDRVYAAGVPGEIVTPQKCDKLKTFPTVAADLKVDEYGRFMWDGVVLSVGSFPLGHSCTAHSLTNSPVA
mmetsp:Transcript_24652/g.41673  ORF Transcript_24652/g.41673 Transcript_24652/m.41673 type:complete len:375 (-) Transcript_24652:329-1453(-)